MYVLGCVMRGNAVCNLMTSDAGTGKSSLVLRGCLMTPPDGAEGSGSGLNQGQWMSEERPGSVVDDGNHYDPVSPVPGIMTVEVPGGGGWIPDFCKEAYAKAYAQAPEIERAAQVCGPLSRLCCGRMACDICFPLDRRRPCHTRNSSPKRLKQWFRTCQRTRTSRIACRMTRMSRLCRRQ